MSRFETMGELLGSLWKEIRSGEEPIALPSLKMLFSLGEELLKEEVPCVFLKQFRDVADGSRACYQAIVGLPMRITRFRGGGLMPGRYRLDLADYQSHPIAADLGLDAAAMSSMIGAYIDVDFELAQGKVIWEAPSLRGGPDGRAE